MVCIQVLAMAAVEGSDTCLQEFLEASGSREIHFAALFVIKIFARKNLTFFLVLAEIE
jgi:hypothetical protein